MKAFIIASCAAFIAIGCQKSEPPAPIAVSAAPVAVSAAPVAPALPTAPDPAVAAVATAETPVAVAAIAKTVPAEADYEAQAQSTITPTNAAQVLSAIDKQVGN
ncbi:MAG: hypothetical protein ABI488_26280 [Polyangiaceae bacterium]